MVSRLRVFRLRVSRLIAALVPLVAALCACRTAAPVEGDRVPAGGVTAPVERTRPSVSARALFDVCWPEPGAPSQKVTLTLVQQGGKLKDVVFESEGAPNTVGRCMQQIAWEFPWEGPPPEQLVLTPPAARPSGWTSLAYVTLLSEGSYTPERGLLRPAPLVRACLEGGAHRKALRYRVQPHPVRVSVLDGERAGADRAVTDAERCVEAVLAATVYPSSRVLELSFQDFNGAPAAAPAREVAAYFGPPGPPVPEGELDALVAKDRISARQPAVSACWDAALGRRDGFSGARTLRIRFSPDGAVAFAQVISNRSDRELEAADYLLDACLVGAVSSLRLPPPGGGGAELAYSWVFARR
jgi:hypothetical protein